MYQGEKSNRRIVIKSNMTKLYIARNEDGSLALFRKKKPKLFWEEGVGRYWVGSLLWLHPNDYPEVTFENSPMEVELVLKK